MSGIEAVRLAGVDDPALRRHDLIIDARAPSEYAEDHLPGAINLPVLDDDERARVGTIYKQVSPFDARKLGAALVARNVAHHLETTLAAREGNFRPLVYCWRGGQRSAAFASILAQVGWRVGLIEGGYKSWRRHVVQRVQELGIPAPVVVLDGNTGSGKTAILQALSRRGHQVIDLEGLANHRGSVFGGLGAQPSQKMFEGRLAAQIEALDPARPVLIEAESSRVGRIGLPKSIWAAICAAPRLELDVPRDVRARFCVRDYAELTAPDWISERLERLAPMHPAERIALWRDLARDGAWTKLAEGLMADHYDPRYIKHRDRHADAGRPRVVLDQLEDIEAATDRVEAALASL